MTFIVSVLYMYLCTCEGLRRMEVTFVRCNSPDEALTLVKEAWRYDIPFPRFQKLQTDIHKETNRHKICVFM